jgi:hypothetical protein
LASGFAEVLAKRKEQKQKRRVVCPHCGMCIDELVCQQNADIVKEPEEK